MRKSFWRIFAVSSLLIASACGFSGCEKKPTFDPESSKYNNESLWAFKETDKNCTVDTFFISPTTSTEEKFNMSLDDEEMLEKCKLQIGNQKGIYDDNTRFFAPFYSQVTMKTMMMQGGERDPYVEIAYADIKEAFEYYLNCYNNGNAIILAGSSQGAEYALRLVKDFFNTKEYTDRFICCYAIGWKVTDEYAASLKNVHFAQGEEDVKCIISFNSEAPKITSSLIVGEDEKTLCINPLNWKTTSEEASNELNLGCCIYSTKGYQKGEDMVGFCGAYIDEKRGTLKVTGVEEQDSEQTLYPSRLEGQEYGVYHVYDWEFFYRNLEANVKTRINSFYKTKN